MTETVTLKQSCAYRSSQKSHMEVINWVRTPRIFWFKIVLQDRFKKNAWGFTSGWVSDFCIRVSRAVVWRIRKVSTDTPILYDL